jgi:Domain of unknown function (DUF4332)
MYGRWFLLLFSVTTIILPVLAGSEIAASPSALVPSASVQLTAFTEQDSCAIADALRQRGLLSQAEGQYNELLSNDKPGIASCAVIGLQDVAEQREAAAQLEASGDQAAAEGNLAAARGYYTNALNDDHGNEAALSGLNKLVQEPPNGIRQAGDYWNQIVANTLVPLGQFFLWLLAVFAGLYVLYLLTRVGARRLPFKAKPSWRPIMRFFAWLSFALGAAAIGATAYIGVSGLQHGLKSGGLWLAFLITAGLLVVTGCLLSAWSLRSGNRVQFSVINNAGDTDKATCAFLAGRLNSLGAKPPRGFDLPQGTDVTSLTGVLTLLPGGGMLSALASFLLARIQVTPWQAVVTVISQDQLLVTLHRNGRLMKTVLADRRSLFFSSPVSGQDPVPASAYVQAIDQYGMLTIAAAIILVSMAVADKRSPLQAGLNGATRWESVAGQVLATEHGLGGNEGLGKALLDRAIDVDPSNLAARVARITIDGRRADDAESRKDFAIRISDIGAARELTKHGYEALRLRVIYCSAAGWCNVFLDDRSVENWHSALRWTKRLADELHAVVDRRRMTAWDRPVPTQSLATSMLPMAYLLATSVGGYAVDLPPTERAKSQRIQKAVQEWEPIEPKNSAISYAEACLAAGRGAYTMALCYLKRAVEIDDSLRLWARHDPSFTKLRAHSAEGFLAIVGDVPPRAFTSVGPLASHAAQLSDIGVHSASDLCDMTSTAVEQQLFAVAIGVTQLVVARWRNIALLASIPDGPDPGQLDILVAAGVDSPRALRAAVNQNIQKLTSDLDLAAAYSPVQIKMGDLRRWARSACLDRLSQAT